MKTQTLTLLAGLAAVFAVGQSQASPLDLAKQHNCLACHSVDHKVVGPAYKEVAAKYKGDKSAEAKLILKVKNGGSGSFGAIPMPPNSNVSEADLKTLVHWVLSL